MTKDRNQAISNQTIPIQDILGQFLGLFDHFLGQKYQKVAGFDLRTHIPWTNQLSWVEKCWSHSLGKSKNIILVQQTRVNRTFVKATLDANKMWEIKSGLPLDANNSYQSIKHNWTYLSVRFQPTFLPFPRFPKIIHGCPRLPKLTKCLHGVLYAC